MNPNELLARETRAWLAKAFDDLESALVLANAGLQGTALYHCQQSAEKSLKAFLTWHNQPFRKTHNLKELGEPCYRIDPALEETASDAHALTDYAWKLRYPGELYVVEEGELEAMMALAANVLREIQSRLPAEARLEIARANNARADKD